MEDSPSREDSRPQNPRVGGGLILGGRRAVEVDPRAFAPRLSLSDLLLMRGAYEETESVLRDLLRVQPPGGIDPGPIRREAARRLAALPTLRETAGSR